MSLDLALLPHTWRGNYPAMSTGDRPLWEAYLTEHGPRYVGIAYNVTVGGAEAPPSIEAQEMRRAWRFNTSKRIDALAFRQDAIHLIEVRVNAGPTAIGSLITYRHLLAEVLADARPVSLLLVTNIIAPDTRRVAEAQGITIYTYPDAAL